jgi:hypothetical protein
MKLIFSVLLLGLFFVQNSFAQKTSEKNIEVGDAYFEKNEYDNDI